MVTASTTVTAGCYRIYFRLTPALGQVINYSQGDVGHLYGAQSGATYKKNQIVAGLKGLKITNIPFEGI